MKINKYYQKGRYKRLFLKQREEIYKEKGDLFVQMISLCNPKKVLDVGCGDGGLGLYIKKRMNIEMLGVDISIKGVELANRSGIQAKVADVQEKIPFQSSSFDAIIANELIEHLYDPDSFLIEIRRILKTNGVLLIGTPNLSFWLNRILFFLGIYPLYLESSTRYRQIGMGFLKKEAIEQPVGHVRVYNLLALRDMLRAYNFEILKIKGLGVAFESSNAIVSFLYRIVDNCFSLIPSLAPDLIVFAQKK